MRKLALPAMLVAALLLTGAASKRPQPPYRSLTGEFARFFDATRAMPEAERVAPIRAKVDADWRNALCQAQRDFPSTDQKVYARYFFGRDDPTRVYPARWGYYVGFRLLQRLGKTRSLSTLDHLGNAEAGVLVKREMQAMIDEAGGCPAPAVNS